MIEIGFEENFVVRSNLVDAREVIKGIAEVVHGIKPVTNWSVIACQHGMNAVFNTTKVLLIFIRRRRVFFSTRTSLKCLSRTRESKSVCRIQGAEEISEDGSHVRPS
jgi:hypothetical protein